METALERLVGEVDVRIAVDVETSATRRFRVFTRERLESHAFTDRVYYAAEAAIAVTLRATLGEEVVRVGRTVCVGAVSADGGESAGAC